jgi:hypothetical protein
MTRCPHGLGPGCSECDAEGRPEATNHPERGNLDKMHKKPTSVQRELEEARRVLSRVIIPPAEDATNAD